MCVALEYSVDGHVRRVSSDVLGAELPIRLRSGQVRTYAWGAPDATFVSNEQPGYLLKWPVSPWVGLAIIKRGDWWQFSPVPVRIAVARFLVMRKNGNGIWEQWIALKRGEYLQGALAERHGERRVYVVTVDPPVAFEDVSPWPRIISGDRRRSPG